MGGKTKEEIEMNNLMKHIIQQVDKGAMGALLYKPEDRFDLVADDKAKRPASFVEAMDFEKLFRIHEYYGVRLSNEQLGTQRGGGGNMIARIGARFDNLASLENLGAVLTQGWEESEALRMKL